MPRVKTPEQLQAQLDDRIGYEAALLIRQAETAAKLAVVQEEIEKLTVALGLAGQAAA